MDGDMSDSGLYNEVRIGEGLITSGQPSAEQLRALAAAGCLAVVNLAPAGSQGALPDEGELVRALGMAYHHIPVAWERPLPADFQGFDAVMLALPPGSVLLHCMANYRVTAFYGLHAMKHLGWTADQADALMAPIWQDERYPAWQDFIATMRHRLAEGSPPPTLVVLAAGIGRRFGGDKQLAEVGPRGETLLDYAVADAARAGFGRALLVLRPDMPAEAIDALLARLGAQIGAVEAVFQRVDDLPGDRRPPAGRRKPWGTGQALWACRETVSGPLAMVNADDYYGPRSYPLARTALDALAGEHSALVAFDLARTLSAHGTVSRGICRLDAAGRLADVVERYEIRQDADGVIRSGDGLEPRELAPDTPASMNLWAFTPAVFGWLETDFIAFLDQLDRTSPKALDAEFLLTEVIGSRLRAGRLRVDLCRTPETWLGLTNAADLAAARELLARLRPDGEGR